MMKNQTFPAFSAAVAAAFVTLSPPHATAQGLAPKAAQKGENAVTNPTYADIVDLADEASVIALVKIRKQAILEPERSPGLRRGFARVYIVAKVEQALRGDLPTDQTVRYLVDVPALSDGTIRGLKGERVLAFARAVPGRPADLQLVSPYGQLPADSAAAQKARTVIDAMAAPGAPPRVKGVRDIISVPGNLAGESETQLFLATDAQEAPLVSIVRRPGMAPQWGVAWGELVDGAGGPPAAETLAWHRLACSLPPQIPAGANLGANEQAIEQARADYALVLRAVGPCPRSGIMMR